MIHIQPDSTPDPNDALLNRVQAVLQHNLRIGPEATKRRNPLYAQFLALVEQQSRPVSAAGYPVIGTHALPSMDDARERGPRHTDAPSQPHLLNGTVSLALNIEQKSSNQLVKGATFDVGSLYLRGDVLVPRTEQPGHMLVATRDGIQISGVSDVIDTFKYSHTLQGRSRSHSSS